MSRRAGGQWALGYREPLNGNERMKRDDDGLNVRERIISKYSKEGFDSIWPDDLRGRFRWWGLYTQRRAGAEGDVEDLEDSHFMLRVRIPGGRLEAGQLRAVGRVAQRYGRDFADVTDRQNVQFHWIRIEDVPAIWEELEAVGLNSAQACGDVPRNVIGCALAGVAADELIDATSYIEEIERRFLLDPQFSNLPRKFKTSVSGCAHHCGQHEINDISFVAVEHGGRVGFDLWVGGGLGPAPRLAQRLGAFVPPERVAEVWGGVCGVFRDYGYRRSRNYARLKFLIGDWGPERFREVLEREYLTAPLEDGPAPAPSPAAQNDHVGVVPQADGRVYVGAAPRAGRTSGSELVRVADLADRFGSGRVRLTTQQKLVVLDVEPDRADALVAALEQMDLQARPSLLRRGTMACTGSEFCKLAVVETKNRADALVRELERRLPDLEEPIRINMNGCPNSCARFQLADIGLLGSRVPGADGERVEGFQVHLGGHLGPDPSFARRVKGVRVASAELEDYLEGLLRRFLETRAEDEPFHAWAARAEDQWLQPQVGALSA
ncbi:nitrite/sulfite reductase [Miltoncostaea marina]|uniref:nitrite/sulfite reductase n=1 Tax=Miltoncostaea marina TaxID=2843215 RepID=UPI001C3E56BF|nr:nitrite/sulfite reductase [Miltoncostaea marina]